MKYIVLYFVLPGYFRAVYVFHMSWTCFFTLLP